MRSELVSNRLSMILFASLFTTSHRWTHDQVVLLPLLLKQDGGETPTPRRAGRSHPDVSIQAHRRTLGDVHNWRNQIRDLLQVDGAQEK